MLDKQINVYSLDTGNFYSRKEAQLHWLNHKLKIERKKLIDGYVETYPDGKFKREIIGRKNLEKKLLDYGVDDKLLSTIESTNFDFSVFGDNYESIAALCSEYFEIKKYISIKNEQIKKVKESLLEMLQHKVEENVKTNGKHHIRVLNENQVSNKNIISVFDSSFTRTIGALPDTLSEDFMVVQVYYFDVIRDLIYYGFMYKGEKYIYFTSSAGQIRTKKCVFIKESVWNKHQKTIMCGLTIDEINKRGGNNPNKHLAYMALFNSATDKWDNFDIDKTIVINDFKTNVFGTYDLVDDVDYSINRMSDYIPIEHTDGAGMILPNAFGQSQKNMMVRLPWIKGLLGVFDYKRFIEVHGCSPIIKDIYGVEHNIIEEDIQVIFTKSQFKLYQYYDSYSQYKEYYKLYNCTAGYTNVEEDRIKDATINYQMLQTLTDITDEEILELANNSISKLNNISASVDNIKAAFGVTPYNTTKTDFQKAIDLYPNLLNDEYVKSQLRDIKDSLIKKYKSGKLQVFGKYTFLLPDFYAACEHWFLGIENPNGLLNDGQVFCWLFRKNEKVDCLRSPHLFLEHAIRNNMAYYKEESQQKIREWFITDGVYTSCKDIISKILQFDVDGDKALVVTDKTLISVAERNIKKFDIVPLYYNMKKASPVQLTNQSIYDGLSAAFTGSNIGQYSNNISKIWNSEVFISGTEDEKRTAVDVVKLLCMENNFSIDYAKTLYKPERPKDIDLLIYKFTKDKLPHFFKFAKDKEDVQVSKLNNTFVNKLDSIINNPRINYRGIKLGKPDYTLLMNNPDIECKVEFTEKGKIVKEKTDPLIIKYRELSKQYGLSINLASSSDKNHSFNVLNNDQAKQGLLYQSIINQVKQDLSVFGYIENEVADILVKYLYGVRDSKHKMVLWLCYGNYLFDNLKNHIRQQYKDIECIDCGKWFSVKTKDNETCRCPECYSEYRKMYYRQKKREQRNKDKVSTAQV